MIGSRGRGPRMCPRCGAPVDARRAVRSVCLSCGQPLPDDPEKSTGTSSTVYWVVGVIGVLGVLFAGITILVLIALSTADDPPPKSRDAASPPPTLTPPPIPTPPPSFSITQIPSAPPSATSTGPAPLSDADRDELPGNYTCSLDDTPAFRCRVANNILEKLDGSQRFRGPVTKLPGGNLSFSGTFFCPFGACTRAIGTTTFVRQGPGRYVGKFPPSTAPGSGGGGERVVLTKVR
jgi:hypothetical protein